MTDEEDFRNLKDVFLQTYFKCQFSKNCKEKINYFDYLLGPNEFHKDCEYRIKVCRHCNIEIQ